jgi:hypothetical protein
MSRIWGWSLIVKTADPALVGSQPISVDRRSNHVRAWFDRCLFLFISTPLCLHSVMTVEYCSCSDSFLPPDKMHTNQSRQQHIGQRLTSHNAAQGASCRFSCSCRRTPHSGRNPVAPEYSIYIALPWSSRQLSK